jgi:hypothetical protein
MINAANSFGNTTINGTLTVTGNAGFQANVSITSALSVGGVFAVTGAATFTANPTLSGGTANGVLYLNGSKVATSGSALTFDGTGKLGVGTTTPVSGVSAGFEAVGEIWATTASSNSNQIRLSPATSGANIIYSTYSGSGSYLPLAFNVSGSEQMRLTSTGLGIGTASPAAKLDVYQSSLRYVRAYPSSGLADLEVVTNNNSQPVFAVKGTGTADLIRAYAGATQALTLDSSGNLGLGVTPSAWDTTGKAIENPGGALYSYSTSQQLLIQNAFFDGAWKYKTTAPASYYQQSSGAHAWHRAASGTAGNAITFTQAMTLDASGNLGLGATSIAALGSGYTTQAVQGANGAGFRLYQGATECGRFYADSTGALLQSVTSIPLTFSTDSTERARITSGGQFLVGKTTYSDTTVGAALAETGATNSTMAASANTTTTHNTYSTGAGAYRFYVGMGGTVYATNTTISAISDQRLKENVRDLDAGLAEVMALKPRKFDWKEGKGQDKKDVRGFIAQEFEQVFPDLIDEWKDPAPEGEEPYKSVRQDLIPVLVKAIQEQQAMINDLKAEVAALKGA